MDEDILFFDNVKHQRTKVSSNKPRKANGVLRMKIENGPTVGQNFYHSTSDIMGYNTSGGDVGYSINKKQRWQLVEKFRTNMASLNCDKDVKVSALEYHTVPGKKSSQSSSLSTFSLGLKAYHSIDSEGREIHKYTKKGYGSEKSLNGETNKHSNKRKKRNGPFNKVVEDEKETSSVIDKPVPHVRFEVLVEPPHISSKLVRKKSKKFTNVKLSSDWNDNDFQVVGDDLVNSYCSSEEMNESLEIVPDQSFVSELVDFTSLLSSDNKRVKKCRDAKNSKSTVPKTDYSNCDNKGYIRQWSSDDELLLLLPPISLEKPSVESDIKVSNFELIPVDLLCFTDNLDPAYLEQLFNDNYKECVCIPRRFVIDISDNLIEKAQKFYPLIVLKEVKAQIAVEVPDCLISDCEGATNVR